MEIESECSIKNGQIWRNNQILFEHVSDTFTDFSGEAYRSLKFNYPKFFKMDALCKLAVLGSSLVLDSLIDVERESVALVFANSSSCIDIDKKHQASLVNPEGFFPSPANFVYTLPNISIGEVSIKYNIKTESAFFVFDSYDYSFLESYAAIILEQNRATRVLIAWIEVNGDDYVGNFLLVSRSKQAKYV